jgi:hypothetical protein
MNILNIQLINLLMLVYLTPLCAQKYDNIWLTGLYYDNPIFGTTVLDFSNNNTNISFNPKDIGFERTNASICDNEGRLLFGTNGIKIFDKNFDTMENGDSLNLGDFFDSFYNYGYNLQQGAFIIPLPNSTTLYLVFHQRQSYNQQYGGIISESYYSLVDISFNGGLGKVISKNVLLKSGDMKVASAVKHGNGRDWWIIVPDAHQPIYTRFLLNSSGVSDPI